MESTHITGTRCAMCQRRRRHPAAPERLCLPRQAGPAARRRCLPRRRRPLGATGHRPYAPTHRIAPHNPTVRHPHRKRPRRDVHVQVVHLSCNYKAGRSAFRIIRPSMARPHLALDLPDTLPHLPARTPHTVAANVAPRRIWQHLPYCPYPRLPHVFADTATRKIASPGVVGAGDAQGFAQGVDGTVQGVGGAAQGAGRTAKGVGGAAYGAGGAAITPREPGGGVIAPPPGAPSHSQRTIP